MKQLIVQSNTIKQQVVDYINATNLVSRYAFGIGQTTLPSLVHPPQHYGDYAQTLAIAKLHVMTWIDQVLPSFQHFPVSFINFNTIIQQELTAVEQNLNSLKNDPSNAALKTKIQNSILKLQQEIKISQKPVVDLENAIGQYQTNIIPDAKKLGTLSTDIVKAEKADMQAIAKLDDVINTLQMVVDSRNELATLDMLSSLTLGVFLTVAGTAVGAVFTAPAVGLLFGLTTTGLTTFFPIHGDIKYQQSIQQVQDDMNRVNTEIGLLNTTVGQLVNLSSRFDQIVNKSGTVNEKALAVKRFWSSLDTSFGELATDMDNLLSDLNTQKIDQALTDVQNARTAWNDLIQFMDKVKNINYQIDTKPVTAKVIKPKTQAPA